MVGTTSINIQNIETFADFKIEIRKCFEPVNRELTARKTVSSLKQKGKFNAARVYEKQFSNGPLQKTPMTAAEQIFHYSQGVKQGTRIEVERSERTTLQEAMRIADRLDSLCSGSNPFMRFGTHNGGSQGPAPMKIGTIPQKRYNRISYAKYVN